MLKPTKKGVILKKAKITEQDCVLQFLKKLKLNTKYVAETVH